jgi:hypothetical protein
VSTAVALRSFLPPSVRPGSLEAETPRREVGPPCPRVRSSTCRALAPVPVGPAKRASRCASLAKRTTSADSGRAQAQRGLQTTTLCGGPSPSVPYPPSLLSPPGHLAAPTDADEFWLNVRRNRRWLWPAPLLRWGGTPHSTHSTQGGSALGHGDRRRHEGSDKCRLHRARRPPEPEPVKPSDTVLPAQEYCARLSTDPR